MTTNLNEYRITILCEDRVHLHFLRSFFKTHGIANRKIRHLPTPQGRGSGKQSVFKQFPKAVKEIRKQHREKVALVVMLDADKKEDDIEKLEASLDQRRSKAEKIVIFIPARNIESWFHWLDMSEEIDETKDYKNQYKKAKPSIHAKKLAEEVCPSDLPIKAPQSLIQACNEFQRIWF